MNFFSKRAILRPFIMSIEVEAQEQEIFAKAKKLDAQLESSGVYEQIPNRRAAQLLKIYLSTNVRTQAEVGQKLEKPLSGGSVSRLLYVGIRQAFPLLDEQARQEYGTPEAALKTKTYATLSQTGTQNLTATFQAYHEGTYTGRPLGGRREPGPGKKITGRPRRAR